MRPTGVSTHYLFVTIVVSALALCVTASAVEVQLAGIRLGQHSLHILQVYGQPDCVILGSTGPGAISTGGGGGAAAAAGPSAGAPPEGPAGGGEGMAAAGPAGSPPGIPSGGPGPSGGEGAPATAAFGGAPTAGGGAPSGTRFARSVDVPDWASVLRTPMTTKETMWCYRRGDVSLAFILDRDGYVVGILVAGKRCDWARTALGEPHRSVKLGDSFKTVIDRYGYPASGGPASGFSRDVTLNYGYDNNIEFWFTDMKVSRIFIWEAQVRAPAPLRLPAAGFAGRPQLNSNKPGLPPVQEQ
jgi:hypothetical protein